MRLLFGLIGVVLVLALVGALVRTQLGAVGRTSVAASGAGGGEEAGAASAAAVPLRQRPGQVADEIGRALEQGARRRADEGEGAGRDEGGR